MPNLLVDRNDPESQRRLAIFKGDLYLDPPMPMFTQLANFARQLTQQHFASLQPQVAQHALPLNRFIEIATALKSDFTNHEYTKKLVQAHLAERGYDLEATYFDVPRLRIATSDGYLRAGVGYAYVAHRDTWYAAPQCQVNWWASLYDLEPTQGLIFYPGYFDRICQNSSSDFDYDEWKNYGRPAAVQQTTEDTRKHPLPRIEILSSDELILMTGADYCVQFSAAHLHGTGHNTSARTRFSIDFRTFNLQDLIDGNGADNVDNHSTGSTVYDFIRASDFSPYTQQLAKAY